MSFLEPAERAAAFAESIVKRPGGILRFSTAGSVDDGKSTLIGRLLYDTRQILEDQLVTLERASNRRGAAALDLSLLTDGLEAEREQGITIDVAYRYFSTPARKFIIADTPGHEQYTRNMATGASTADAAVILADATKGLLEQSKRHLYIAHLLGIRHIAVAVNKMDLVGYRRDAYGAVCEAFEAYAARLTPVLALRFVPLSALLGDMVVERGDRLPWYDGPTLLEWLESVEPEEGAIARPLRFPVQLVQRATGEPRTYLGRVASGAVVKGQTVVALPSGRRTTIERIRRWPRAQSTAYAGESVGLTLADEIDISRGDFIVDAERPPAMSRALDATLVWLSAEPLAARGRYLLKHASRTVKAKVAGVRHVMDVRTLGWRAHEVGVGVNDIAHVALALQQPLFVDSYAADRATGAFILIDEISNQTVAAGMIE